MRKRDFLKKKAEQTKDQSCWDDFKTARNEVNNSIKYVKCKYFSDNLAASRKKTRKTWQLINELSSRQHMKNVIADIEIGDLTISSAFEMAEAFNCHFANIGHDLARDIPLMLILFQKAILFQLMRLSLLKVLAPMKSENYLKN